MSIGTLIKVNGARVCFLALSLWIFLAVAGASQTVLAGSQMCDKRANVLNLLAKKYGEMPVAFGVTNGGGLVELLRTGDATKADTWTLVITSPDGITCLMAAGEGWRDFKPGPPDGERT